MATGHKGAGTAKDDDDVKMLTRAAEQLASLGGVSTTAAAAGTVDTARGEDGDAKQADERGANRTEANATSAAERRDAETVATLEEVYFESDVKADELAVSSLSGQFDADEVDRAIEAREALLHAVTNQLARQVQSHREEIVEGIDQVATVEDDLNAGYALVRNARRRLAVAADEAAQSARVAEGAALKRKLAAVLHGVQQLADACALRDRLRSELEARDYASAVRTCALCMEKVAALGDKAGAAADLKRTVERLLEETVQRIDGEVRAICLSFDAARLESLQIL